MIIQASWIIGLLLAVTAIIVFISYSFFELHRERLKEVYRNFATARPADNYESVSGWLYLWLVTALLIAVTTLLGLLGALPPINHELWATANDPMASAYHPLLRPVLLFKLIARTALLWIASVMAMDFFRRRRHVPKLVIGFLLANLMVLMTEQLLLWEVMDQYTRYLPSPWKPFRNYECALALGSCVVWIPYFLNSKRVKVIFSVRSYT
ncbi:MAG TPA: DUF2569 family protein [Nitrospira sp.]|nr:DUF2569 family protein [Nitrospira sp.]